MYSQFVPASIVRCVQSIVFETQIFPCLRSGVCSISVWDVFSKYHSKAPFQVPVNVAVKEPGPCIVSLEPDCDIVTGGSDADNVAANGVLEVIVGGSRAADHIEDVTV